MQKVEEEGEIVMVKEHRELDRTGTRKGHIVIKVSIRGCFVLRCCFIPKIFECMTFGDIRMDLPIWKILKMMALKSAIQHV